MCVGCMWCCSRVEVGICFIMIIIMVQEVKFLFTDDNSIHQAIEDNIRSDLADVGIRVIRYEASSHDDFNQRHAVSCC